MKKLCVSVVLACGLCGCVELRMDSREDLPSEKTHYETVSVLTDDFAGFQPRLVRTEANRGAFSIVCGGSYRIVRKRTVETERSGTRELAIGFLPGIYWMSETVDGTDHSEWPLSSLEILLANGLTGGFPTLLSLFFEPFDSYHDETCSWWSSVAGYGLLGCCKRNQCRPWTKRSTESYLETIPTSSYALSDYTIYISGLPFRCRPGEDSVSVTIPTGARVVSVQVDSVPSLSGELGSNVSSLKGLELEVDVQGKSQDATAVRSPKDKSKATW